MQNKLARSLLRQAEASSLLVEQQGWLTALAFLSPLGVGVLILPTHPFSGDIKTRKIPPVSNSQPLVGWFIVRFEEKVMKF